MAADAQLLFDLFDSYWFSHQILKKTPNPPPQSPKNEESAAQTSQNLDFSAAKPINTTCYSDQQFISSPNSVLSLQTPNTKAEELEEIENKLPATEKKSGGKGILRRRRRRKGLVRSRSKSLSELEFEELKGFMDLGYRFSEEDKDSSLVWMIPGLQRLGKDEEEEVHSYGNVSRPYLSEAWGDLEKMKEEASRLMRIPAPAGNESDMKLQIRFWAHSVASVVR
ncbi:hypothetical protein E3N88_04716 [Mikania micrantha]|uniref:DUF1685 domain-containing protein n=1 Tax=Mikania micrantha TaxID=192012 RepID=A0A5N6PXC7_9ASTR|nr:hypothetical protein E3N88_04716 [Mikania micrantha]